MDRKVSLILVADDRLFLSQAERAGEKAGKVAGERIGKQTRETLRNWELPAIQPKIAQAIGAGAGIESGVAPNRTTSQSQAEKAANEQRYREEQAIAQKRQEDIANLARQRTYEQTLNEAASLATDPAEKIRLQFAAKTEGVNRRYDELRSAQVEKYDRLGASRTQAINLGKVSVADSYVPQMNAIATLVDQNEKLRASELRRLNLQKEQALLANQTNTARTQEQQRAASQRQVEAAEIAGRRTREQSLEQAAELSNSPGERIRLQFDAKAEGVNRKFDEARSVQTEKYNRLNADRNQALVLGETQKVENLTAQMNAITALIEQNEKLRASELKILEIQEKRAALTASRKAADASTDNTRSNRDAQLKTNEAQRIGNLQNERAGLKDPVAIAAINREINQVRATFDRDRETNKINDALADLETNRVRQNENRLLGIQDPKLSSINFASQRQALIDRRSKVNATYGQQVQAAENTFQSTVNREAQKTESDADRSDYSEKVRRLQASLANTNDESLKVKIRFEIDEAKINENFRILENSLTSHMSALRERQTTLSRTGQANGDISAQITQTQAKLDEARTNREAALRLLTENSLIRAGVAEFQMAERRTKAASVVGSPNIALNKRVASDLLDRGQLLEASIPGRSAALAEQQLKYESERSSYQLGVQKARASGINVPQEQVDGGLAAIDRLNSINIEGITQKFNNMAGAISASNLELRNLAQKATTGFLEDLIGGVDTFDKTWKKAVKGITDGMIQILAKQFSGALFNGAGGKDSGGGLLSQGLNYVGKILGFDGGGVIDGQSHEFLAGGSNPIAEALRKEGAGGTVVVGKRGERILNLAETAAYHAQYPNGIMNADRGGIIGGQSNSNVQNGGFSKSGGISGKFEVDLKTNDKAQPTASADLGDKLTQIVRSLVADETREGGIIYRAISS
jgi:hypothetical protein